MQTLKDLVISLRTAVNNGLIPKWLTNEWVLFLTMTLFLLFIISLLTRFIFWLTNWQKLKLLDKDLSPYYTKAEIYHATKNFIPTKYQNVAPSEDEEPGRNYIASAKNKLIPLFLNKVLLAEQNSSKYYLLLADTGMGKTTFLINLYINYIKQRSRWKRPYNIKLIPLGHPSALDDLEKMHDENKKDTILLLDALDEDAEAIKNYQKRLLSILDKAWRFRRIIITCRTQFFPSKAEEPTDTGYVKLGGTGGEYIFQKLYISIFDDNDINQYLSKRFPLLNPFTWKKRQKARAIVRKSPSLMARPMLLSHIGELVESEHLFAYRYEIYDFLIEKWLEREANKPGIKKKYGSTENFKKELSEFCQKLAIYLYFDQQARGGFFIHKDEKVPSSTRLQLSDLDEDIEIAMKASGWRTHALLNRNAEGYYKFSHNSVLEYFLAKEAINNESFMLELKLEALDTASIFCEELAFSRLIGQSKGYCYVKGLRHKYHFEEIKWNRWRKWVKNQQIKAITINLSNSNDIFLVNRLNLSSLDTLTIKRSGWHIILYKLYTYIELFKLSQPVVLVQLDERLNYYGFKHLTRQLNLLVKMPWYQVKKRLSHLELIDLLKYQTLSMTESIQQEIDARGLFLQKHNKSAKQLIDELTSGGYPYTIDQLQQANEFIKKCQALEKAMSDVEIIY